MPVLPTYVPAFCITYINAVRTIVMIGSRTIFINSPRFSMSSSSMCALKSSDDVRSILSNCIYQVNEVVFKTAWISEEDIHHESCSSSRHVDWTTTSGALRVWVDVRRRNDAVIEVLEHGACQLNLRISSGWPHHTHVFWTLYGTASSCVLHSGRRAGEIISQPSERPM